MIFVKLVLGERSKAEKDLLQRSEVPEAHLAQGDTIQKGQRFCLRPR